MPDDFWAELWRSPHHSWNMDERKMIVMMFLRSCVCRWVVCSKGCYGSQSVYLLGHHAPACRAATSSRHFQAGSSRGLFRLRSLLDSGA